MDIEKVAFRRDPVPEGGRLFDVSFQNVTILIINLDGAAMKKNMGQKDRTVRAFIGVIMLVYAIVFHNLVGIVGLIPLATAIIGYCPLYEVLGVTSNKYAE